MDFCSESQLMSPPDLSTGIHSPCFVFAILKIMIISHYALMHSAQVLEHCVLLLAPKGLNSSGTVDTIYKKNLWIRVGWSVPVNGNLSYCVYLR